MEEYLKTLLDNEVKPLWPKGWMQSRYVTLVQTHIIIFHTFKTIYLSDFTSRHALTQHVLFQGAVTGEQEDVEPLYAFTVSTMKRWDPPTSLSFICNS